MASLAVLLVLTIAAAEPKGTLTLACQGTTRLSIASSPWSPDEPSSMSLLVNFATQTVTGLRYGDLSYHDEFPVGIGVNDLIVMFGGSNDGSDNPATITGTIYRMTGDVYVRPRTRVIAGR